VPNYAEVIQHNVYPGIDARYSGDSGQLQLDFVVHPGATASAVALDFSKFGQASLNASGQLIVSSAQSGDSFTLSAPVLYQLDSTGAQQPVSGKFVINVSGQVGFQVGSYDPTRDLIIDPTLVYSTYLGGMQQVSKGAKIAVDSAGSAYAIGSTFTNDFPTANPFQPTYGGGLSDATVTKFSSAGTVVYSTYLGGSKDDHGNDIAVDATGTAYLTGNTNSTNFPVVAGSFQTSPAGTQDGFITRLSAAGNALVFSGYLDSSGTVNANGLALDSVGNAYVASEVSSTGGGGFPTTAGVVQSTGGGDTPAVTKISADGKNILYSTFIGGTSPVTDIGSDVVVDGAGNAYVTGAQSGGGFTTTPGAFQSGQFFSEWVVKLNAAASAYVYSTELSASTSVILTPPTIALDAINEAVITGQTDNSNYPTTPGVIQPTFSAGATRETFVTKVNTTGTGLTFSTFLGGPGSGGLTDVGNDVAIDSAGNIYVTGTTQSPGFPLVNPLQAALDGTSDGYVAVLNPTGSVLGFSTYLGGSKDDSGTGIALDSQNNIWVDGTTASNDFPLTPNAFVTTNPTISDAFVSEISAVVPPGVPINPGGGGGGGGGGPPSVSFSGDIFEPNDTSDVATNFGSLGTGSSITLNNLTIADHPDGTPDYDWFRVTAANSGTFLAGMTVTAAGPLELHLWVQDPASGAIFEVGEAVVGMGTPQALATAVNAGETVFVEVKGTPFAPDAFTQGVYNLQLVLV
jgi:hypothetical protein